MQLSAPGRAAVPIKFSSQQKCNLISKCSAVIHASVINITVVCLLNFLVV